MWNRRARNDATPAQIDIIFSTTLKWCLHAHYYQRRVQENRDIYEAPASTIQSAESYIYIYLYLSQQFHFIQYELVPNSLHLCLHHCQALRTGSRFFEIEISDTTEYHHMSL